MIFDIKGLGGVKGADKTKAKAKAGATGGPSFASMLEGAQGADLTDDNEPLMGGMGLPAGYTPLEEELPKDAQGQAKEMLKTLKDLAQDALSGSPTQTVGRLEALAGHFDESALSADQKKALDEVRTRAAVEVAKLKG